MSTTEKKGQKKNQQGKQLTIPESKEPKFAERQGVFEFALLSYNHPLPGQAGYDKDKDELRRGFNFSGQVVPSHLKDKIKSVSELSAYDYLTSPLSGLRAGEDKKPHGAMVTSLMENVGSWHNLPPVYIWKRGMWLWDLVDDPEFDVGLLSQHIRDKIKTAILNPVSKNKTPASLYCYYVVSGEGTPGNYLYRIYDIPERHAGNATPLHPASWPKPKEKPKTTSFLWGDETPKPLVTPKPQGTGLPFGVKARCTGCGHWYKIDDLPNHSKICPREEPQDFAVMCVDECGCRTLDEASQAKPGFPRAVVKPPAQPTEVVEKPLDAMTKKEMMAKAEANNFTMPKGWSRARMLLELEEMLTQP